MVLIDGKKVAQDIRNEVQKEVANMMAEGRERPHLTAILVGSDPASETYVASKEKACEEVGFTSSIHRFTSFITEKELLDKIIEINNNPKIHGLIVQLPLPKHINERLVIETINPRKDVDGFHSVNVGRLTQRLPTYIPATPLGVITLIEKYNIPTSGKHCVVLGRSNIVGSPLSILMARNDYPGNSTVTLCHSKTENLKAICKQADILIVAIGKPEYVTAEYIKEGATVIDVGIHRVPSTETKSGFKLKGDVKFDEVAPLCSYITPVPGGVGAMTIASLLMNTLWASKNAPEY